MAGDLRTIHDHHHGWDHSLEAAARVAPGERLAFRVIDASGGQLGPDSSAADLARLDFAAVNPVTGPIHVEGAEPGDALAVTILDFEASGWGWTAAIPGFGLLADQFPDPYLKLWTLGGERAEWGGVTLPLRPFPGTIGVAPAAPGLHSVVPPRRCGGNVDIRDLCRGAILYLPVEVSGALFSVGDTHAAQGDGEVCGTAIESPMTVSLAFDLIKDARLPAPQFRSAGPVTRHLDERGYYVTTGVGPDLFQASRDAVMAMIDHLGAHYGLDPVDAYLLGSVACDLRILEVVDAPNWLVGFYLPLALFG